MKYTIDYMITIKWLNTVKQGRMEDIGRDENQETA